MTGIQVWYWIIVGNENGYHFVKLAPSCLQNEMLGHDEQMNIVPEARNIHRLS